jgi:hypothetical protein
MNESGKKLTALEATVGIIMILALFVIWLFNYGGSKGEITLPKENINPLTLKNEIQGEQNSPIFNNFVEKIFESKVKNQSISTEELGKELQTELLKNIEIPEFTVTLSNIGNYSANKYLKDSDSLYAELKSNGGTDEAKIFADQIVDDKIMPLAQIDKETLLRIASIYEVYAEKMSQIPTPSFYEKKATNLIKDALKVSYILKKIVVEQDEKIYPLWISKYSEIQFDIIANRYEK